MEFSLLELRHSDQQETPLFYEISQFDPTTRAESSLFFRFVEATVLLGTFSEADILIVACLRSVLQTCSQVFRLVAWVLLSDLWATRAGIQLGFLP